MSAIFARLALTAKGWAEDVRLTVADGRIASLTAGATAAAGDRHVGIVIPGLANAHSHAFQRVLAGHTEQRAPRDRDNFWTWRSRMYALAAQIDAAALRAIATQAYTEMVATGYTAVAEFHYLLNEPGEGDASDRMFRALAAAAADSGIRLTYVPVLYERAGFDASGPNDAQRRFALPRDAFITHYETIRDQADDRCRIGIGAHSLRAVTAASLAAVAAIADRDGVPMHLHVAEQRREVEECIDACGARPVEWLLDRFDVDDGWCLVHATHMNDAETARLARSGAVVCLCPSTEANLGDGLFPLQAYLEAGGRIAIGSDSHVTINPFEELRWLEYGQRLASQRRNVAAIARPQTGRSLFDLAVEGGARAVGQDGCRICAGGVADLVVLDDDSPMLAGHTTRSLMDALVFSGFTLPIDRVMVAGEWRVVDGRHANEDAARRSYNALARRIDLEAVAS